MRSVRARCLVDGAEQKELAPAGHRADALVLADRLARMLLESGRVPDLWPPATPLRVVVSEGCPDFLDWSTNASDADTSAPAVLGVFAGSWTAAIASRVPDGARVVVRSHHDPAGEAYAREIFATFGRRRVTLIRGGAKGCSECASWLTRGVG